jgi:hypothetical protein
MTHTLPAKRCVTALTTGDRVTILGGANVGISATLDRHDTANDGEPLAWIRVDGQRSAHLYPVRILAPLDQVSAFTPLDRANARGFLFDMEAA